MMYDPTEDRYHLHYQWHPQHINWGNISYGHAVSDDLITWTDVGGWQDQQAQSVGTGPNQDSRNSSYYGLGIFSGSAQPYNLEGEQNGTLTMFYTCVQYLPISWSIPYTNGSEKLCIVTSDDGGETWNQWEGNPLSPSPPQGWNITGWRDPFVEPWPEMDAILGRDEPVRKLYVRTACKIYTDVVHSPLALVYGTGLRTQGRGRWWTHSVLFGACKQCDRLDFRRRSMGA
jgi:beta-fructofuranosidase